MPPLRLSGLVLAVRSEERAVFLANVKVVEVLLLTTTIGTPAGLGQVSYLRGCLSLKSLSTIFLRRYEAVPSATSWGSWQWRWRRMVDLPKSCCCCC